MSVRLIFDTMPDIFLTAATQPGTTTVLADRQLQQSVLICNNPLRYICSNGEVPFVNIHAVEMGTRKKARNRLFGILDNKDVRAPILTCGEEVIMLGKVKLSSKPSHTAMRGGANG